MEEKKEFKSRKKRIETQEEKPVSEWKERVVQIRRVTKVVKGGKKLSFRAIVIVGNQKGQVGVGCAKAAEVIIAIQKAIADGRKNLIEVPIFKTTISPAKPTKYLKNPAIKINNPNIEIIPKIKLAFFIFSFFMFPQLNKLLGDAPFF